MAINIMAAPTQIGDIKPRITVVGVGGAGGNAVSNMIASDLQGVDFVVANTDAQALSQSRATRRIQLGSVTTQGLGAGSRPEIGRNAAEEAIEEIIAELAGSNMVFITAGMGGGTGTGAAPVIARAAKEQGILTVGVVTKPFHFEGQHRMRLAETGISAMQQYVDTLIIIPNQNLFRIATERTTFADAFKMADDVLHSGVRGITDLMMMPGLINLDFADIRTVMTEMGKAHMGTGEASGEKRALDAAEAAISNPLLEDTSMKGAKGVLINITGGSDLTLFEVDEAANRVRDEVDPEANIIFGSTFDDGLSGRIRVSVVATGIESEVAAKPKPNVYNIIAEREKREEIRQPEPAPAPVQVAPEPVRMVSQAQPQPQPIYAAPSYAEPEEMVMSPRPAPAMFANENPVASAPSFELTPTEAVSRPQKSLFARMTGAVAGAAKEKVAPSVSSVPVMQATAPRLQMPPQPQVVVAPQAAPVRPNPAPVVKKVVENSQPVAPQPRLGFNTVDAKPTSLPKGDDDLLDIPAFLRRQAN